MRNAKEQKKDGFIEVNRPFFVVAPSHRAARNDAGRQHGDAFDALSAEQLCKPVHGKGAKIFQSVVDAAQFRRGALCDDRIVVPHDGNVFRNAQSSRQGGVENARRQHVVRGDDGVHFLGRVEHFGKTFRRGFDGRFAAHGPA